MVQHELVQRRIITIGNQALSLLLVKRAGLFQQVQERLAAVVQVRQPWLDFGRAKRMHIEANILALPAVTVALEGPDLVKGYSKISAPKRLVLVKLQSILIVEV